MKSKILFLMVAFQFLLVCKSFAQRDDEVSNKYWDLLVEKTYKLNASKKYVPYFPPSLMALNNKKIALNGYIIPIKSGISHDNFLLSVLPVLQCQYCGLGDIPEMVIVYMKDKIKFTEKPILLEGILKIDENNMDDASFSLSNAVIKIK
jgi:hypothetical protein